MLLLYIINLNLVAAAVPGVIGGQPAGFFEDTVRKLVPALFHDHMGAGGAFGVEPTVVPGSK